MAETRATKRKRIEQEDEKDLKPYEQYRIDAIPMEKRIAETKKHLKTMRDQYQGYCDSETADKIIDESLQTMWPMLLKAMNKSAKKFKTSYPRFETMKAPDAWFTPKGYENLPMSTFKIRRRTVELTLVLNHHKPESLKRFTQIKNRFEELIKEFKEDPVAYVEKYPKHAEGFYYTGSIIYQ